MKRILSLILCIVMCAGLASVLTACNPKPAYISKGDWLVLLTEGFGMNTYTSDVPYAKTVDAEHEYFSYVQAAFEWDVIDDEKINLDDYATKGFLATTLVKCVGLADLSGMSDDDVTAFAVENGYVDFPFRGRTDSIRYVTYDQAVASISKSVAIWTDRKYETVESVEFSQDIFNLSETVAAEQVIVSGENTVKIPQEAVQGLEAGETFILPAGVSDLTMTAYKAENITIVDGYAVITTGDAELETTVENLKLSGSQEVDLMDVQITDGMGNVVSGDASGTSGGGNGSASLLGGRMQDSGSARKLAKKTLGFSVDGLEISGTVNSDGVSFSIKGDIYTNEKNGIKTTVSESFEVSDISVDYDWDISWFKLKSAYVKLNYTTKNTAGVSISWEKEGALFADQRGNYKEGEDGVTWWKNFHKKNLKPMAAAKGAKTITICSFPIVNGGVARLDIDIKAKISVSGSVELVITTRNASGMEYKNGNLRYIKETDRDVDLTVKAKVEGTVYVGLTVKALGKFDLLGAGFEIGLGVEFTTTLHLVDTHNVKKGEITVSGNGEMAEIAIRELSQTVTDIHPQLCGDLATYVILKFTIDQDCMIAEILEGKRDKEGNRIKLEIEFLGKHNATIPALSTHIEDWKFIKECTREFSAEPEETNTDSVNSMTDTTDTTDSGTGSEGGVSAGMGVVLDIDTYFLNLLVGNTDTLRITDLPEGYGEKDVVFTSANPAVAKVDSSGKITAVGEGATEIIVSIAGTEYKVSCSVVVNQPAQNGFTGLKDTANA